MGADRGWKGRVSLGMSVDGYIARSDGDVGWLEDLSDQVGHVTTGTDHPALVWETFFPDIDLLVMGRGTYEKVLEFDPWPFGDLPVIVLSTVLQTSDQRVQIARSLDEAVAFASARAATNVYVDGGATVRAFLRGGLIDELTISLAPIILGEGIPLFADGLGEHALRVLGSHVTDEGLVRMTFALGDGT